MSLRNTSVLSLAALAVGLASEAQAAFVFTVSPVGNDVVTVGAGTINTAGLSFFFDYPAADGPQAAVNPPVAGIAGGPTVTSAASLYDGASGPARIGPAVSSPFGFATNATSGTGDLVGASSGQFIFLPVGYVSGTPLANTNTYANATISSLGFTPGTYVYTFGSGLTADSLTINVVPEPTTLAACSLGAVALLRRRRRHA